MLTFAPYFWPAFWTTIGIGAAVTVALCLAIAIAPAPHARLRARRAVAFRPHRHHGLRPAHHAHA